ncbi:MAG: hypothetical protein ACRCYO_10570 [Bacteroidia bacterium]
MKKLFFFAFLFSAEIAQAWTYRPLQLRPGVSIGYIFGAGFSFGGELNYTPVVFRQNDSQNASGLFCSLHYFYSKGELYKATLYHTFSTGLVIDRDNQWMAKLGMSKSVLPWGRDHKNKTKSKNWSPTIDLSYAPWKNGIYLGYQIFLPGNACFGLDIKIANRLYSAYRFNVDELRQPLAN